MGTVASNPSSIKYDVSLAVTRFYFLCRIDRSANSDYADIQNWSCCDGKAIYSSDLKYPKGIKYDTSYLVDVEIPKDTDNRILTIQGNMLGWRIGFRWGLVNGKLRINDWSVDKRREINNEHPLLMMPLYNEKSLNQAGNILLGGNNFGDHNRCSKTIYQVYTVVQMIFLKEMKLVKRRT